MQRDKERRAQEAKTKEGADQAESSDSYESSSDSEDEESKLDMNALLLKNIKDIDSIVNTPRSRYTTSDLEFPLFEYEEGGKIEMPWYTEAKKLQK